MLAIMILGLGVCLFLGVVILLYLNMQNQNPFSPAGQPSPEQTTPSSGYALDNKDLKMSGRYVIGTKDGKRALEVILKKGEIHGGGSNTNMSLRPAKFFPATACRIKFKLYFDDKFPWTKTGSFNVGGKLGGFDIGHGQASGSNYSTTGASYRLTFKEDRQAVAYLYPQLKRDFSGDVSWEQLDQTEALKSISYIAAGVHIFSRNRKADLAFKSNQWNSVEMYMKLNTPGKSDGIMELAVNGERRRLDQVRYRYTGERIEEFKLAPFFGGGDKSFAPPADMRLWYTDFEFSST